MNIFNMIFSTLDEALRFFGFEPVTPIPACQKPTEPSSLGFAGTASNYEMVGGRLFWFRDEGLFTTSADNGDGLNTFDGEKLRHISLVEGIDAEGFSTPLLVEWNPASEAYHRQQLAEGTIGSIHAIDEEGSHRVAVFITTPAGRVFVMVVTPEQYPAVEALAYQLLNRA